MFPPTVHPLFNPQFLNIPPLLPPMSWLDILTKLADLSQNFFSSYQKSFFFYPVLENSFCQVKTENNSNKCNIEKHQTNPPSTNPLWLS